MSFPWEAPECTCVECVDAVAATELRPELRRDANGMYPGQQHPLDLPDFLNRATNPLATNRRS